MAGLSKLAPLLSLAGLLAAPASAALVPFSGTTTWTQVEGVGSNSADTFVFAFTAAPDLEITQIDFVLGNGTATGSSSSLRWDFPGAPVNGGSGAYAVSVTSGSVATTNALGQALTLAARSGAVTFTSFTPGNSFTLSGDVDKTLPAANCSGNCDVLNFADFTNGGGFAFTVYFASTSPSLSITGPSSFTFGPTAGWTSGTFDGQPGASLGWSGNVDMLDTTVNPEPGTMLLVGAGLVLAGLARRKGRNNPPV
jgi:hypothetical protein